MKTVILSPGKYLTLLTEKEYEAIKLVSRIECLGVVCENCPMNFGQVMTCMSLEMGNTLRSTNIKILSEEEYEKYKVPVPQVD